MDTEYELQFKSSPNERYDTDLNDRVRMYLDNAGVKVTEEFGGSNLTSSMDDPDGSDNGWVIAVDGTTARQLATEISILIGGRDVEVREYQGERE